MKRSKSIGLVTMGVSVIALTACEEPQVDALVFDNLQQCLADQDLTREQCETNYSEARNRHVATAPKYTSQQACEADFGSAQCEQAPQQTQSGGSVFMPLMMGYMMGSMLSGPSRVATQPLYRSKDNPGNFRTADNKKVAGKTGLTKAPASVTKPPTTKTRTVRRNGFGATAARSAGRTRSYGG